MKLELLISAQQVDDNIRIFKGLLPPAACNLYTKKRDIFLKEMCGSPWWKNHQQFIELFNGGDWTRCSRLTWSHVNLGKLFSGLQQFVVIVLSIVLFIFLSRHLRKMQSLKTYATVLGGKYRVLPFRFSWWNVHWGSWQRHIFRKHVNPHLYTTLENKEINISVNPVSETLKGFKCVLMSRNTTSSVSTNQLTIL